MKRPAECGGKRAVKKVREKEMIRRIRQGEKELFEDLAEEYYQEIYHFCFYKTGDAESAWDCTQETFLHVIRFLDGYTERNHFRAWIFGIARNVCNDYFRSRKHVVMEEESLAEGEEEEEGYRRAELKDSVQNALNRLPEMQKEVIILRFYHDMKIKEIAAVVGAGIPTVKSRLKQGMEKMKHFLEEEGG